MFSLDRANSLPGSKKGQRWKKPAKEVWQLQRRAVQSKCGNTLDEESEANLIRGMSLGQHSTWVLEPVWCGYNTPLPGESKLLHGT